VSGTSAAAASDAPPEPGDTLLFARKGAAAPASASAPPASPSSRDRLAGGVGTDDAGPDDRADPPTAAAPPAAASLDADPFDPLRPRAIVYDTAPTPQAGAADNPPEAAVAAPARLRPSTVILTGAAALAVVAALFSVASWYDYRETPPQTPPVTQTAVPAAPVAEAAPPAPATPQAVIDLVRIEPGGDTVIAGRAAPGTALIVLDNDTAIGSVVVGESGDWMLTPERALAGGNHEIALAVKAGDGAVAIATPRSVATPAPRPAAARYVVQIASVRSAAGADQEWSKLKAALPELLGGLTPSIDTADLRDRGIFHRIRLGPFDDRDTAHGLCAALNKAGRDCLVVRR
jgi:hypothetical protein